MTDSLRRVLVIDDNEDSLKLITFILNANGFTTYESPTGRDGLAKAADLRPDFIILDIMLPDIDGLEVLTRLKADQATQDIPVIASTSHAMVGDREKLLAAGCAGYVEKPLDTDRVIGQILEALS